MLLKGKVALVTGGSKRIGRDIALSLAKRGADVVISYDKSYNQAGKTASEISRLGVKGKAIKADLTKNSDVKKLIQKISKSFGRLDILINNAAIFERTPFNRLNEKDWDRHINTNLKAPFLCSLLASSIMKRSGGKIINIADISAKLPYKDYLPYNVSKAGLIALTKSLAKELAPAIQVIAIAPGAILAPQRMSSMKRKNIAKKAPLSRWGNPKDITNACLFAIEGTDFMTGNTIFIDGGRTLL